jgi:putative Ca2+/H+ antiporter (TMEM165/GDT1 family)
MKLSMSAIAVVISAVSMGIGAVTYANLTPHNPLSYIQVVLGILFAVIGGIMLGKTQHTQDEQKSAPIPQTDG